MVKRKKTEQINFRTDPESKRRIEELAHVQGVSIARLLMTAVDFYELNFSDDKEKILQQFLKESRDNEKERQALYQRKSE